MGRRGPPPKPTALKLLEGTFRSDRAPENEPTPDVSIPEAPDWLGYEGRKEWDRVTAELEKLGMITELDRTALAFYCDAIDQYIEVREQLQNDRLIVVTETGSVKQNPLVLIRNECWKRVLKGAAEFGMSPSSRSRVSIPVKPPEEKPSNPFAALVG